MFYYGRNYRKFLLISWWVYSKGRGRGGGGEVFKAELSDLFLFANALI